MSVSRFALTAAFIAALGIHSAYALEVEDGSNTKASVNLADPDDQIPVAHLDDNGKMQQSPSGFSLQMQGGSQSSGFGFSNGPSAFERAQQNQSGQ